MFKSTVMTGVAAAVTVWLLSVNAAVLKAPYTGEYDTTSVVTGGNSHTIWLSGVVEAGVEEYATAGTGETIFQLWQLPHPARSRDAVILLPAWNRAPPMPASPGIGP